MLLRFKGMIVVSLTAAAFACVLLLGACDGASGGTKMGSTNPGQLRDTTPVVLAVTQPGAAVVDNGKAIMDFSNASEGYFCVLSKLGNTKVKVLVNYQGSQYQYTITNGDTYITVPLSCGNGVYSVGVWENVTGDQYAAIFSQELNVTLSDENKPFLYPNQYVNFAENDPSTQLSQQSATGATSDVEALGGIYQWIIENVTYDKVKAAEVQPGYLPKNTDTINTKTGICFDYAVLAASMLREQRIPATLVIGYSDTAYHAWIRVYCQDTGKVLGEYSFNNGDWVRMDPTFDASSKGTIDISGLVGSGSNYQPLFYY